MKKVLKWIGIALVVLLGLVLVTAVVLSFNGRSRLAKTRDVEAEAIAIHNNDEVLARGEHLVRVACQSCHGPDLTGQPLLDDPAIGTIFASNITGLGETHSDADLIRAIRHAVAQDGRQLMVMPAESFVHFSAEDLAAIIVHLKTVPAAGKCTPEPQLSFLGRTLLGAGIFGDVFPAEYIDHQMPFPIMPEIGANVAYGAYVGAFCTSCHGADLRGGQPADPQSPPAPNLTQDSRLSGWTEAQFLAFMRSGITPDGRQIDPLFMPWESFGKFGDEELRGLWMYLQTLPAQ